MGGKTDEVKMESSWDSAREEDSIDGGGGPLLYLMAEYLSRSETELVSLRSGDSSHSSENSVKLSQGPFSSVGLLWVVLYRCRNPGPSS